MKKYIYLLGFVSILLACNQKIEKEPTNPLEPIKQVEKESVEQQAKKLEDDGYKTFLYKEGDSTYLMQQYFMVFLKSGENRSQDSTETAQLQSKHLEHLGRMAVEGYASLIGPFEDEGDVRGIVVYNTRTLKEADSLANLDPMVKAGRLKVEVHPWWTAKGGKLN
tara:strand:+ start:1838 stop:2332 length:495 start_codon:yes stop_codon:yes gene_type:complete